MIVLSYCFENCEGSNSVVLEEYVWVGDASVNMSFGCNVHNCVHLMNETIHELRVANISLNESVTFIILNIMQIRWVSPYADFINVYQFTVRVLCKYKPAEVASDKS